MLGSSLQTGIAYELVGYSNLAAGASTSLTASGLTGYSANFSTTSNQLDVTFTAISPVATLTSSNTYTVAGSVTTSGANHLYSDSTHFIQNGGVATGSISITGPVATDALTPVDVLVELTGTNIASGLTALAPPQQPTATPSTIPAQTSAASPPPTVSTPPIQSC